MMLYLKIWIILLAYLCASIEGFKQETLVKTLPGYAITTAIDQLNSTRCQKEMEEYRDAVDHRVLWSIRMLDSSGRPLAGFITGNNYWLGHRAGCEYLNRKLIPQISEMTNTSDSPYRKVAEQFAPFEIHFFGAHIRHNSTMQYHVRLSQEDTIILELCLPASCSEHEIATMLQKVFDDRILSTEQLYSMDLKLIRVTNLQNDYVWLLDGRITVCIVILLALLGVSIVGTLCDLLVPQKYSQNHNLELKNDMEEKQQSIEENGMTLTPDSRSRIVRILVCFSIYSNIQKIFKITNTDDTLIFHSMKVISSVWVVVGHTFFYAMNITTNMVESYLMANFLEYQVFVAAPYAVETFFFISGYLMTFSYLKLQTGKKKVASFQRSAADFVGLIIRRYIRLTPAYAVTILITIVLFTWEEKVSLWLFPNQGHHMCLKYWWTNMLYINNFLHWDEQCINWSWYLSNDMQFYIFGIFLLFLSSSYYYVSLVIGVASFFGSIVATVYVGYDLKYTTRLDKYYLLMTEMYIRPWIRFQPYIIGMGTALFAIKLNNKLHLSKKTLTVCWCLFALCNFLILFGMINRDLSVGLSTFHLAGSRFAWSLGIAWLTIACITNNAGIVNKFLTLPCWIPLSKVTYCVYLLNPIIIISVHMFSDKPYYSNFIPNCFLFIGITVTTYVCAILFSATVESPMIKFLSSSGASRRRYE